jgi:hypothetical protein
MKTLILSILFCLSMMSISSNKNDFYMVYPNYTDEQIRKTETDILNDFQINIQIEVVKRDENNQIVHLMCSRFNKKGEIISKCMSDKFGQLKITKISCSISDL